MWYHFDRKGWGCMRIALLTGASSGLGREIALRVLARFPEVEEIWLVARRAERLEALAGELGNARAVSADITGERGLGALSALIAKERPEIALLVNNAGCGFLGAFDKSVPAEQERMVALNCLALTSVTRLALPYMPAGARILNIASIAAFVPNANMAVYSATKSYVLAFSRALGLELKPRGIAVTAVCPGPMDTEFLRVGRIAGNSKTFRSLPYCDSARVAEGALRAAARGRSVWTPRAFYKFYRVVAHVLPKAWLMPLAKT